MSVIHDEYSWIADKSKRYALCHPDRVVRKQRRYLAKAETKYKRHQYYLNHGTHWNGTHEALKTIVKRSLALEFFKYEQWAYANSFDGSWLGERILLLSDLLNYMKERKKYYEDKPYTSY